jgi:hypothetical protein
VKPPAQPPQRVPVLTEVVVLPKAAPAPMVNDDFPPLRPMSSDPAYAETAPAPFGGREPYPQAPTPVAPPMSAPVAASQAVPSIDEARVVQRVLADLDKQLDLMFEHRLREALTPVLTRMTDSLVREMRNQLAAHLREMVAKAVSLELDRQQKR